MPGVNCCINSDFTSNFMSIKVFEVIVFIVILSVRLCVVLELVPQGSSLVLIIRENLPPGSDAS